MKFGQNTTHLIMTYLLPLSLFMIILIIEIITNVSNFYQKVVKKKKKECIIHTLKFRNWLNKFKCEKVQRKS